MTLSDFEDGRHLRIQPDVEDGSRLVPMHRFHDPGGALFATLPQWPRMNSKPARSMYWLHSFIMVESHDFGCTFTP
jgi:hypothetical protein